MGRCHPVATTHPMSIAGTATVTVTAAATATRQVTATATATRLLQILYRSQDLQKKTNQTVD